MESPWGPRVQNEAEKSVGEVVDVWGGGYFEARQPPTGEPKMLVFIFSIDIYQQRGCAKQDWKVITAVMDANTVI